MAIKDISSMAKFESKVLNENGKVLVDFWATWCGPCMMMGPVLEDIDAARRDVKVFRVNVDEEPDIAAQFNINSIPAFLLFENGKLVKHVTGAMPIEMLRFKLGI